MVNAETMVDVPCDGTTVGEIVMRGNVTMTGYLDDAKATEKAFKGGWFRSGDLAVMHPDGYIEIKDRDKDIIISGGENISVGLMRILGRNIREWEGRLFEESSAKGRLDHFLTLDFQSVEVENCILSHPKVLECCVIASPDDFWGERPKAFVVLKPDALEHEALDPGQMEREIVEWCRARLANYKCPSRVELERELPKVSFFVVLDSGGEKLILGSSFGGNRPEQGKCKSLSCVSANGRARPRAVNWFRKRTCSI